MDPFDQVWVDAMAIDDQEARLTTGPIDFFTCRLPCCRIASECGLQVNQRDIRICHTRILLTVMDPGPNRQPAPARCCEQDWGMDASGIIDELGMSPHPEGGHYVETWRGPERPDGRAEATAIYFLLTAGERSHWHTVDASELWLFHAGSPLDLEIAADGDSDPETVRLGCDLAAGERPQAIVPVGAWQAARSTGAWTLVSCVVAPGFQFDGFTLAPRDWDPGAPPID